MEFKVFQKEIEFSQEVGYPLFMISQKRLKKLLLLPALLTELLALFLTIQPAL